MVEKVYVTYNEVSHTSNNPSVPHARVARAQSSHASNPQIHKLCQKSAPHILDAFKPNLMIAIGGGGYVPARILR
jgi:hypothetical protein